MQENLDTSLFFKPVHPSMYRRCKKHDYRAKSIYMITIRSNRIFGLLSGLKLTEKEEVVTVLTPVGIEIMRQMNRIHEINPNLKVIRKVIMPDHIHFLLYVSGKLEMPLGKYIAKFKGLCSKAVWEITPQLSASNERFPLFESGFNDKILRGKDQLQNFKHYIDDNPRRLWIARNHPEFFNNKQSVIIDGGVHDAFGNFFLLEKPLCSAVIVSSKYTPDQKESLYDKWREIVRQGGVLIGAFVSEEEQRIKYGALRHGASIIQIKPQGFGERYKPSEKDMFYCAQGQLLELGFKPYTTRHLDFSRRLCLDMNEFAGKIAAKGGKIADFGRNT